MFLLRTGGVTLIVNSRATHTARVAHPSESQTRGVGYYAVLADFAAFLRSAQRFFIISEILLRAAALMCRPDFPDLDLPEPAGRPGPRFFPDPRPCSAAIAASNLARSRFRSSNTLCMSICHLSLFSLWGKTHADFNRYRHLIPTTFSQIYAKSGPHLCTNCSLSVARVKAAWKNPLNLPYRLLEHFMDARSRIVRRTQLPHD